jgi:hypothetical protein
VGERAVRAQKGQQHRQSVEAVVNFATRVVRQIYQTNIQLARFTRFLVEEEA